MKTDNTGGMAFPSNLTDDSLHIPGMTQLDYFAAKAMQALLHGKAKYLNKMDDSFMAASTDEKEDSIERERTLVFENLAIDAYSMAKAMLRAREESK